MFQTQEKSSDRERGPSAQADRASAYAKPSRKKQYRRPPDQTAAAEKTHPPVNATGIPAPIKQAFEKASGLSFDNVRIHYRSEKPARLSALAYTVGNKVYLGPGQESCLPHELDHVVQQKQGLVYPTRRLNGLPLNDSPALEQQADRAVSKAPARTGGIAVQRLANDPSVAVAVAEQDTPLTAAYVTSALTNPDNNAALLQGMRWQKEWVKKYKESALSSGRDYDRFSQTGKSPASLANFQKKVLEFGRKALFSNTSIARDLYVIRQQRDSSAKTETKLDSLVALQATNSVTLGTKKEDLSALYSGKKNKKLCQKIKTRAKFNEEQRKTLPFPPGKQLGRLTKGLSDAEINAFALTPNTKAVSILYREAGKISNEARLINAGAQAEAARMKYVPPPQMGHDASTKVPFDTTVGVEMKANKYGPALAEVTTKDPDQNSVTFRQINDPLGRIPKKLHPTTAAGILSMNFEEYASYTKDSKGAGSHAEVYAANKALIHADSIGEHCTYCGIIVRTPIDAHGKGAHFAQCPHCKKILAGVSDQMYAKNKRLERFLGLLETSPCTQPLRSAGKSMIDFAKSLTEMTCWNMKEIRDIITGLNTGLDEKELNKSVIDIYSHTSLSVLFGMMKD